MNPELSVIVPLYNEEESVGPLHEAIVGALDPLGREYEILFVDDGSRDATFRKASELAMKDRRLRVIKFRRNYGQTPAMAAGIDHARQFGVSKSGISRIYQVIIDLLVVKTLLKFSVKPMHLFATGGLVSMAMGGAVIFRVLAEYLGEGGY